MKRSRLQRGGSLKPVSSKRAKINRIYSALRKAYLASHLDCEWWLKEHGVTEGDVVANGYVWLGSGASRTLVRVPPAQDIHHRRGRGKYLLDTSTWMAVSRAGHDAIHANPKESYEKGYMMPRN